MDLLLKKVYLDYEFNTYKVLATNKSDGFNEFYQILVQFLIYEKNSKVN